MVRKIYKKRHRLHDLFRGVVDHCDGSGKNAEEKKELLSRNANPFDVTAESALEIIETDKTLSAEEKRRRPSFLLAISRQPSHSLVILMSREYNASSGAAEGNGSPQLKLTKRGENARSAYSGKRT
ncbi:Hypothetical protein FKW44_010135 [Caligus rogercresseyi]|uniref:Uncharacterized protein n=1 Tax=Caligus rogercresseyi TaxID=217165 RepID=A0A7T8HH70_CALRO|nr:Hypothetical protein FKW44_010135 [Caligus rogercresseyi]